jgi:hypothetical protein
MKIEQRQWIQGGRWEPSSVQIGNLANLVFIFGETSLLKESERLDEIRKSYPKAHLFGCSTSGEIHGNRVCDDTLSTTAVYFEKTEVRVANLKMSSVENSFVAGKQLASRLHPAGLTHVLVLSVGLGVNGSELVKGLTAGLPDDVSVTGGLAGDKDRFKETLVISDGAPSNDTVAVVGLYGNHIQVGSASLGGWDPFGPERIVTKSNGNVLYELDGKSALELYKTYLGSHAKDLPGSALLFPLCLRGKESEEGVVRTILSIDDKNQTMTFAGDLPEGSYARFMKANFDRLVEGAVGAAENSKRSGSKSPDLALLISCVGRKLVLRQRVEEEVEGVRQVFGDRTVLTGFYSYGEISPFTPNAKCELHNQTMTITTLTETDDEEAA